MQDSRTWLEPKNFNRIVKQRHSLVFHSVLNSIGQRTGPLTSLRATEERGKPVLLHVILSGASQDAQSKNPYPYGRPMVAPTAYGIRAAGRFFLHSSGFWYILEKDICWGTAAMGQAGMKKENGYGF